MSFSSLSAGSADLRNLPTILPGTINLGTSSVPGFKAAVVWKKQERGPLLSLQTTDPYNHVTNSDRQKGIGVKGSSWYDKNWTKPRFLYLNISLITTETICVTKLFTGGISVSKQHPLTAGSQESAQCLTIRGCHHYGGPGPCYCRSRQRQDEGYRISITLSCTEGRRS